VHMLTAIPVLMLFVSAECGLEGAARGAFLSWLLNLSIQVSLLYNKSYFISQPRTLHRVWLWADYYTCRARVSLAR